jgi:glycosyltransferase involved in cell wall biosynthesis
LNVGSSLPRKRLDVLLDVFAAVRNLIPQLRLIQVGGPWPSPLADQIVRLGIASAVTQISGLTRQQLAELYRRAAAVLITSDAEGFGLPVIEALACGAAVVASDIPVLREVGGSAVDYCSVADVAAWADTVTRSINESSSIARRRERVAQASLFSWNEHARIIGETYLRLAAGLPPK